MEERRVGAGIGVLLLKDGKVLLGKRNDNPEKASSQLNGAGTWTMPGGKIHFGESFEDAAERETLEEAGIRLNSVRVISLNNNMVDTAHFVTIGLISDDFKGDAKVMEPDEITEWGWFDLQKLPEPLYFPSRKIIRNYLESKFYLHSQESKQ